MDNSKAEVVFGFPQPHYAQDADNLRKRRLPEACGGSAAKKGQSFQVDRKDAGNYALFSYTQSRCFYPERTTSCLKA
jgi:hypothetical protein